ncbi:MAG: hypothetical protein QNJ30_22400 [Kiloniellales bacterium]|nr:hypothetical protein [Kiloniellales bacterium]
MSWLFLNQRKAVDRLVKRLERIGVRSVTIEDSDSAYVPARMILSVPWKGDLELIWHRQWWDGIQQEDNYVALKFGDEEERIVGIAELFRQKFDKPLIEVIIDHIADAVQSRLRAPAAGKAPTDDEASDEGRNDDLP